MITSPEPWSIVGSELKDSQGNSVALFKNYSDAEYVRGMAESLRVKEKEIEDLEDRINGLNQYVQAMVGAQQQTSN